MYRKNFRIPLFVLLVVATGNFARAQTGRDTNLWTWSTGAANDQAIVQVFSDGGFGTGTIVHVDRASPAGDGFQGLCLTAWHVVKSDRDRREIKVTYKNGKSAKNCMVVAHDEPNDIALIWVWVPATIVPAPLAAAGVVMGDPLEFAGLGGGSKRDCCLRHFTAVAAMTTGPNTIFADAALLPGDSGGPVFNQAGQLTGVISGGWFWWDGGVKAGNGVAVQATWPARASNLGPIVAVLATAELALK